MQRVYYYTDELTDDFAQDKPNEKEYNALNEDFEYLRKGKIWRSASWFLYRCIATPVAYLTCKIHYGAKYVNRRVLKNCNTGCFLYINHTMMAGDAFNPSIAAFPKKTRIIVGRRAFSTGLLKTIVPMVGGVPVPGSFKQTVEFKKALGQMIEDKNCVAVYPEVNVWRYYTGIRNFKDVSFRYPAELGCPVFTATVTWRKRKFFKRPRAIVYIDGPFYADESKPLKLRQKELRDTAYDAMRKRSQNSNSDYVSYLPAEENAAADEK